MGRPRRPQPPPEVPATPEKAAPEPGRPAPVQLSLAGLAVRLYWLLFGNLLLFAAAALAAQRPGLGWADGMVVGSAAALIGARALDLHLFHGRTADGEPATRGHLVSYAIKVAVISAGLWGLAKAAFEAVG